MLALPQQSLIALSSSLSTDGALILSQFRSDYVLYILLLILWWKSAPLNAWCQDITTGLNLTQRISATAYAASWAGFGHIPAR